MIIFTIITTVYIISNNIFLSDNILSKLMKEVNLSFLFDKFTHRLLHCCRNTVECPIEDIFQYVVLIVSQAMQLIIFFDRDEKKYFAKRETLFVWHSQVFSPNCAIHRPTKNAGTTTIISIAIWMSPRSVINNNKHGGLCSYLQTNNTTPIRPPSYVIRHNDSYVERMRTWTCFAENERCGWTVADDRRGWSRTARNFCPASRHAAVRHFSFATEHDRSSRHSRHSSRETDNHTYNVRRGIAANATRKRENRGYVLRARSSRTIQMLLRRAGYRLVRKMDAQ